jgi:hypothetical protein
VTDSARFTDVEGGASCAEAVRARPASISASPIIENTRLARARATGPSVAQWLLDPERVRTAADGRPWRRDMLETVAVLLIMLWLLGLVSGYTLGNFIYILLVIAIVLILVRLVSGRTV